MADELVLIAKEAGGEVTNSHLMISKLVLFVNGEKTEKMSVKTKNIKASMSKVDSFLPLLEEFLNMTYG